MQQDLAPDAIAQMCERSWDELFDMADGDRQAWQDEATAQRFDDLAPRLTALSAQAEAAGITRVGGVDDVVPLLFQHTAYKSYPIMVLEKNRFDLLTRWLQSLTTVDLSGVDARGCEGIDAWLALLEANTPLRPYHTSGTTGKLSFLPRTTIEVEAWNRIMVKTLEVFGGPGGEQLGGNGVRVPVIYPSLRYGRYVAQRQLDYYEQHVAPTPADIHVLSHGTLSADIASLSGRVRVAQAKGELGQMTLSDAQRHAFRQYLQDLESRPEETKAFLDRIFTELRGERVLIFSQTSYLVQAAQKAGGRGKGQLFAPNSFAAFGGGGKDVVLPDNYEQMICDFTGLNRWARSYAMSEVTGTMPLCEAGFYHVPPYLVPFALDPESGEAAPRKGSQTGRFACMDLVPQTYWGGIVTGDKVTIEYDSDCPCGRKGPRIHDGISRYSDAVTGDDKITCSATVDNTDAALRQLLDL